MGIEELSPWISLLSGVLSIGYVVVDDLRKRSGAVSSGDDDPGTLSLSAVLADHEDVILVALTMFFVAGLAHWYLRGTAFFYPVLFWGTAAFVTVVTAISEATAE